MTCVVPPRGWTLALLLAALVAGGTADPAAAQESDLEERVQQRIRLRLEADGRALETEIGSAERPLRAAAELSEFYEDRTFRPAWIGPRGEPRPPAGDLVRALRAAPRHGLRPGDYRAAALDSAVTALSREAPGGSPDAARLAGVDLALTDAFLTYGAHLLGGRVDPRTIDPLWTASGRAGDLSALLREALAADRVRSALEGLAPDQPGYADLRGALERYRALERAGGWPAVPDGPLLREGDAGDRVAALWSRLAATGDLPAGDAESTAEPDRFDDRLAAAVRRFQRRHGLEPDGVVGDETLAALNVPVGRRVRQIELNLERWRWMPRDLGRRHVRVNIADYRMRVMEGDSAVLEMRAIVGRHYRQTPVFSDTIRYVVVNPSWVVPNSIALNDILPQVRRSTSYLERQDMAVYRGWGGDAAPVDPSTVDWSSLGRGNFPYRFVQRPGPLNALGQVKFMFPNRFSVYMHDTPARGLFSETVRSFSSGCIRLERPLELLDYLFRGSEQWTPGELRRALDAKRERTISLPEVIPVHVQYWTAWAEEDGTVHFRPDVYDRDERLAEALGRIGGGAGP